MRGVKIEIMSVYIFISQNPHIEGFTLLSIITICGYFRKKKIVDPWVSE